MECKKMDKSYSDEFYDDANDRTLLANRKSKTTQKFVLDMVYIILESVADQLCKALDKNLDESYVDENFADENFALVTDEMLENAFKKASKATGKNIDTVKALIIGTNGFHLPIHDFCNMLPEFLANEEGNDNTATDMSQSLSDIMLDSLKNLGATEHEIKTNLNILRINVAGKKLDKELIKIVSYQLLESLYKYVDNNTSTTGNEEIYMDIITDVAQATNQDKPTIMRIIEEKIGLAFEELIQFFIDYLENDSKDLANRMYNGLKSSNITKKEIKQKLEALKAL